MTIWEFARGSKESQPDVVARTLLLSEVLLRGPARATVTAPYATSLGICGVGVLWNNGVVHPVLLANGRPEGSRTRLPSIPPLLSALAELIDTASFEDVEVVGVPSPELHVAPGDGILKPRKGTVGSAVQWNGGQGYLTAGHVAKPISSSITTSAGAIGKVVYVNDPAGRGRMVMDDVAVIEVNAGVSRTGVTKVSALVPPNGSIQLRSATSVPPAGNVMGKLQYLYFPSVNGTCGDVYMTTSAITLPGDSGAAVVDGSNAIIGHVLGASPGFTSYIQDVHYQLKAIGTPTGLSGIALG